MEEAFVKYIQSQKLFQKNHRILVGVSGGLDSVTLCELLHTAGYTFAIAHCNFGLRGSESDADDIFVESLAQNYKVPHFKKFFETEKVAGEQGISIQMAARELRFEWFEELRIKNDFDFTAVATHHDDNIETFFINLLRGTGLKGLTGIEPKNHPIVRPLLFASRNEILKYARSSGYTWREDSSNENTKYLRNKLRAEVIPVLKKTSETFEQIFHDNFQNLDQAHRFIEDVLNNTINEIKSEENGITSMNLKPLRTNSNAGFILFHILHPYGFNRNQIEQISDAVFRNHPGKQFFSGNYQLTVDRDKAFISGIETLRKGSAQLPGRATVIEQPVKISTSVFNAGEYEMEKDANTAQLDYDKLKFPLLLRFPKKGDRFVPLGMKGSKLLSDYFIDEKIPQNKKSQIPVVESAGEIVWVFGMRISDRFKITSETKTVYVIQQINE